MERRPVVIPALGPSRSVNAVGCVHRPVFDAFVERATNHCAGIMRSLVLTSMLFAAGCAATQKAPRYDAELRVVAVPEQAVVSVNERFVGAARVLDKRPAKLTAGKKRVTVEASGYFPHDFEVDLKSGLTTVEVKLRPVPR